jgi:hypothetical protein
MTRAAPILRLRLLKVESISSTGGRPGSRSRGYPVRVKRK